MFFMQTVKMTGTGQLLDGDYEVVLARQARHVKIRGGHCGARSTPLDFVWKGIVELNWAEQFTRKSATVGRDLPLLQRCDTSGLLDCELSAYRAHLDVSMRLIRKHRY